jgi:uncharacterized protein YbcV (DUF1398 family)
MKSIREKAEEAERNTHPLFETIKESTGEPVSVYDQNDMISMFEAGANYVIDEIEKSLQEFSNYEDSLIISRIIEQLKK